MKGRVLLQPAYLLHQRPYRDTSRILELLTREYGRVTLFARGVRRAGSPLLSVLQPFNRLLVSWSGRGEAMNFAGAELDGTVRSLSPGRLMSAFYANELLLKLLARNDQGSDVFALYEAALAGLKSHADEGRELRLFEKRLLEALGYGLTLEVESGGEPVDARYAYRVELDRGPTRVDGVAEGSLIFSGSSLLSLAHEELDDASSRSDARRLLKAALDRCLEGRELRSREVATAVRRMRTGKERES